MLPLRDAAHRHGSTPVVVILLVAVNLLVFLGEVALPGALLERVILSYGLVPSAIAADPFGVLPSGAPVVASLVTSLFLHSGTLHLAGNMVFLWVFGDNVEDALGHLTFLLLYIVSGVCAALAHVLAFHTSGVPSVGASGAVAGVLAGYLLLFPRTTVRTLLMAGPFVTLGRVRAVLLIGIWAAAQVVQGVVSVYPLGHESGGVGYIAHVAGFLTGALLVAGVRLMREQPLGHFEGSLRWGWIFRNWAIASGLVGVLLLAATTLDTVASPALGQIAYVTGMSLVAVIALGDGIRRLTGHGSQLAAGGRLRRALAAAQMALALGLLGTALVSLALL